MRAMILPRIVSLDETSTPLMPAEMPVPEPGPGEILVRVSACGVCHTELDEIEGRTPPPRLPVIPGHQVVGYVDKKGRDASRFKTGERVGIGWIYSSCGSCRFCAAGNENLCESFLATGRDANGGYAEYMTVREEYAFHVGLSCTDAEAAPLLCAGGVGYRALMLTGLRDGENLGLTGFGASGHLVFKLARHTYPRSGIFVFARSSREREFAMELGADWAGDTSAEAPEKLHTVIDTTPAWKPVVEALKNLQNGGRLVINAIRKENTDREYLQSIDYGTHLWNEKEIKSVANVTRRDISEFLALAAAIPIIPEVRHYPLEDANIALMDMKRGSMRGAGVLLI